jgi:hypothetical protein
MIQISAWVRANWLLLAFLILIASSFALLRSKPSDIASFDELNGILSTGQPSVVAFYSNL